MENPKAFVSHASEDKQRFAIAFAEALRSRGVDAWVDQWEIKAGDSLVQKIFEEGIRSASAVIVILSRISVTKRWVREELDSAVVARIEKGSRLIPVVIEDCEIPISLQHIVHIRVPNFDATFAADEIARTLFDANSKPALGSPPAYARRTAPLHIPGLQASDEKVLMTIGEIYLAGSGFDYINRKELVAKAGDLDLSEQLLAESLEILGGEGYIEGLHTVGTKFAMIRLRVGGAEAVMRASLPDYAEIERKIAVSLANNDKSSTSIAQVLGIPQVWVDYFLMYFKSRGLIATRETVDGRIYVFEVSPKLKRAFSG